VSSDFLRRQPITYEPRLTEFYRAIASSRITERRDGTKQVTLTIPLHDNGDVDWVKLEKETTKRNGSK
jgi:hypothetical protein